MELLEAGERVCTKCATEKPVAEFAFANKARTYRRGDCRSCQYEGSKRRRLRDPDRWKAYTRKWSKENASKRREASARYRLNHPDKPRADHVARYGISVGDYEQMVLAQAGVCAACGEPERRVDPRTKRTRRLAIDHCHDTGRVRGLLCTRCNTTLGVFNEDLVALARLLAYLAERKEEQ